MRFVTVRPADEDNPGFVKVYGHNTITPMRKKPWPAEVLASEKRMLAQQKRDSLIAGSCFSQSLDRLKDGTDLRFGSTRRRKYQEQPSRRRPPHRLGFEPRPGLEIPKLQAASVVTTGKR